MSDYDDRYDWEIVQRFRDPGGNSSLHPGVRTEPCPTCKGSKRLTKKDVKAGYQCDECADRQEMGLEY